MHPRILSPLSPVVLLPVLCRSSQVAGQPENLRAAKLERLEIRNTGRDTWH
jgi:hypothetical protein